ncbi:unnamed protein product, partial [Strongylus vulgaris]
CNGFCIPEEYFLEDKPLSIKSAKASPVFRRSVYCRYFDKNWYELVPPVRSIVFPEFGVHCCRHPEAKYMSISVNIDDVVNFTTRLYFLELQLMPGLEPQYELSLCLAPLYDNETKWLLLAELFEHYKLQGVEHFYLYVKDIDNYSRKVLTIYAKFLFGEIMQCTLSCLLQRRTRQTRTKLAVCWFRSNLEIFLM